MKNTIHRTAAFLMCLLVLLSLTALTPAAADNKNGTCGTSALWAFTADDATLRVTGSGAMTDYTSSASTPWRVDDTVWKNLYTVDIAKGITHLSQYAFAGCVYFTGLFIADSVTSMGSSAFANCAGLTAVTLPNKLGSIPTLCFSGCVKLKTIVIPATVTSIGDSAFANCTALTDVYFCGTQEQWNNITVAANNTCLTGADITFNYVPKATATFEANNGIFSDGKAEATADFALEEAIIAPETPTREGYAFMGWYPEPTVMDELRPRIYTATWEMVDYSLTFFCDLVENGIWQKDTYHFGDEIDMPAEPSYNGYRFTGWTWKWDNTAVDAPVTMPSHNLTATANLEHTTYTVKLTAGDTVFNTISADYFDEISLTCPEGEPAKRGYEFLGWTDGKTVYAYGETVSGLTPEDYGTVVLTAKWNALAPEASVTILNNPRAKTFAIDYRQGITLTAVTKNMPEGAAVHWFVNGTDTNMPGNTFTKKDCREGFTVTAKLYDADGKPLTDYDNNEIFDEETVTVNAGFFKKLIAFFKGLFGTLKTVVQSL